MTPEQLKASILQYAIQGKLVEQRPEEGTGEELYQQIQAEKQRLIAEKKIKKEKQLAEIPEDEIPFDIPESWKWVKVGEIGSWGAGATPPRTNPAYYGGTIPWLKTGDLNDGLINEIPEFITDLALEKTSVRLNPVGSVLMAMYGATIGKLGILEIPATTNQACCACIPYNGIHNRYLFYYLMSMRRTYISMAEGGAQPNISKEKIVNSLFPLPPLAEQKRIVAKIEKLFPLVDRYAVAYEKLEQFNAKFPEDMKKSILQYAIQGQLVEQRPEEGTGEELYQQIQAEKQRLIQEKKIKKEKPLAEISEDEIPFDIPESWKWVRLSDIIDVRDGTHDSPKYVPMGIPLVTSKNLSNGTIDYGNVKYITQEDADKINARSMVDDDDILFAMIGSIGNPVLVKKDREFCIKNMALFKKHANTDISMRYMYWFFFFIQYKLKKEASGGVQSFISLTRFREYLVPLPPFAEQKRIVAKIEELLPLCERLK
ncbi:MAG TPA: restriction endonuclease subunit S [Candidatus Faeciplasma gallinarum]|uniref:Restriction endonuclease subunit S n=1 Tax=Candidatus Faeciplasma gallinarum TaxID=2840799 RepID=A0A9D1EMY3_9FIRM|nr:restriction endonuclease subunit S [Candidatus Faeciplasma gallinarum]